MPLKDKPSRWIHTYVGFISFAHLSLLFFISQPAPVLIVYASWHTHSMQTYMHIFHILHTQGYLHKLQSSAEYAHPQLCTISHTQIHSNTCTPKDTHAIIHFLNIWKCFHVFPCHSFSQCQLCWRGFLAQRQTIWPHEHTLTDTHTRRWHSMLEAPFHQVNGSIDVRL